MNIAFLALLQLLGACRDNVASFVENDPVELSDVDLAIARLRFYPYYRRICSAFEDVLDKCDETLEIEASTRTAVMLSNAKTTHNNT